MPSVLSTMVSPAVCTGRAVGGVFPFFFPDELQPGERSKAKRRSAAGRRAPVRPVVFMRVTGPCTPVMPR